MVNRVTPRSYFQPSQRLFPLSGAFFLLFPISLLLYFFLLPEPSLTPRSRSRSSGTMIVTTLHICLHSGEVFIE